MNYSHMDAWQFEERVIDDITSRENNTEIRCFFGYSVFRHSDQRFGSVSHRVVMLLLKLNS